MRSREVALLNPFLSTHNSQENLIMKRTLYGLILLAAVLMAISAIGVQPAVAQVPPGVVVDSIADAINWQVVFPFRSHHVVADPMTQRMAFISGTAAGGGSPIWLSSSDNGQTWNSLTGFLSGGAGRVAIAADKGFTTHIAYRAGLASGAIAIYYDTDAYGDGTGLGTPVMVNDTNLAYTPNYPDIAVSDDGKNIMISAIRFNQMDTMWVFVSHDSGATWSTKTVVSVYDPALAANATPGLMWYGPNIAMGKDGYGIVMCTAQYDSMGLADQYWELYSETRDYGETWSTPAWLPPPPASEYSASEVFFEQGTIVVVDSTPHLALALLKPNGTWESTGPREMVEFHKENGSWVHHAISHFDELTGSFNLANNGNMCLDTLGNLYCVFSNRNYSALPSFYNSQFSNQMFIAGSSDGGKTWTDPVRLTGLERQAAGENGDVKCIGMIQVPPIIADDAAAIWLNGVYPGLYTGGPIVTAWAQARFPLNVVWTGPYDKDTHAPKPGGYEIAAKGASPYNWYEISGIGTKVDGWKNGPLSGDAARDDGYAGPFPIGFNFWYYGQEFSTFHVAANGLVGLSDSVLNSAAAGPNPPDSLGYYSGYKFPGSGNPFGSIIAAFYNDLDLTPHSVDGYGHGDVYYWTNAAMDTAVVEWYQAGNFNSDSDTTITFEVIMAKGDSSVAVMFKDIGNTGSQATAMVGVQQSDSVGVGYWFGGYPTGNEPLVNTGVVFKPSVSTGIIPGQQTPLSFALLQNYPNPFNPSTTISYSLPRQMKATLKIFNILGQEVATLVNEVQSPGAHSVNFNASKLASGVYIYRLQAGEFSSSFKMVLMK
jgi:hypothetical protein